MEKEDIVSKLYDIYMEKFLEPDEKDKKITTELMEKVDEFKEDLTEEQGKKVERILDIALNMSHHTIKKAFVGGYKIGARLTIQALYNDKE